MKYLLKLFTIITISISFTAITVAQSQTSIKVATAYNKGNSNYDVVVKDPAGTKLRLYVNDKNPINATSNKHNWATFHKVSLTGHGKLSFTRVQKRHNGSTYERPINYTSLYNVDNGKVAFDTTKTINASAPVVITQAPQPTVQAPPATNTGTTDTNLSNNSTYTNVNGNTIHSPAASTDGSVPSGATAQCADGTYSFSQHHSGTCSRHGGVSQWLQ
jgi:hypothetical protein